MISRQELKQKVINEIDRNRKTIIESGTYLYENPELGFKEKKCSKLISDIYKKYNLDYRDNICLTGSKAELKGKNSLANIAIIGEMDAVYNPNHLQCNSEGASHCCGHNAQIAIMLAIFIAFMESEAFKHLNGDISFIATPAEELLDLEYRKELIKNGIIDYYSGKQNMIKEGIFDNIDLTISSHACANPEKYIEIGVDLVGFIVKKAEFLGKPAHSGLSPHLGVNALSAANLCLNAVNSIRETFKESDYIRISPIIKDNALALNVIPEKVDIESYIRASTIEGIISASEKFDRCIKGSSYSIGTKYNIVNVPGYLPFHQDIETNKIINNNALDFLENEQIKQGNLVAASGDIGDISAFMPTVQLAFGGFTGIPHGNTFSVIDPETAYLLPAKILACSIIDLLFDDSPEVLKIKENYKPKLKNKKDYIELLENLKKGNTQ